MTDYKNKKMIICDLDGTLAESKQTVDAEMATLISQLLERYCFAVESGGNLDQLQQQVVSHLQLSKATESKLFLLPTSGAALFTLQNGSPVEVYQMLLTPEEITVITNNIDEVVAELQYPVETTFGPIVEARGSQVTYSAMGQNAPIELKSTWDPDQHKRRKMQEVLEARIPDFQIGIGGTTSIDITRKFIDKAYGIEKLAEHTGIAISDMLYVGDALYTGGNDAAALRSGIESCPVAIVQDTKDLFRSLL